VNATPTKIPGMLILEPRVFRDERGSFFESFQATRYRAAGIDRPFVQDCFSRSVRGVVRGLHYQLRRPQGKLCSVLQGEVFDVAVDLRRGSPAFGTWVGVGLSAASGRQVYLPPGLAHGFCVVSDEALFHYKCTELYAPQSERTLLWNDPHLAIAWPVEDPILSAKDLQGVPWHETPCFDESEPTLPDYLL
jgi:dTDP-4-dehydrorhamnose 3,5-epimerase